MTSATDPHRRFQRQIALHVGACWIVALLAAAWAWRVPVPAMPAVPALRPSAAVGPSAVRPDPSAWNIALWKPFSNEAPTAAPAAPQTLKLLSVMQQGDGLTAAISAGDTAGMVFLKAGDSSNGFTVLRVEAHAAVLRVDGRELRLELGQ
jgi:hypothetical protein